jgi:ribosomal protein RSM22 (predicted rRNA methylase)
MTRLSPALPAEIAAAVAALLDNVPRRPLAERARRLSVGYRANRPTSETIRDETDALAYAAARLPATYAAAAAVLSRLRDERPDFAPRRILDLGCGLGAASFAALEAWPNIESVTLLDRSREFLALARRIAQSCGRDALAAAKIVEADIARSPEFEGAPFDLVLIGYALTELPDAVVRPALARLWPCVGGALVVVEPGTPRDHARLMTVRGQLVSLGAVVAAPCPHSRPCPLVPPDWCHFSVRLPRSRDHRLLKGADAPFEDEKYSYLVAMRGAPDERRSARILAPPLERKPGISLKLCSETGICETSILKRDKARYGAVRRKVWGDLVDAPAKETAKETE